MILYSYFRSSAAFRVRIALNLKEISYDYRAVHLLNNGGEQHSAEYTKLNPSHEVPTLVHEGKALGQSLAIMMYLDQVKPEPALFPKDAHQRALVVQAAEIINSGAHPPGNLRVLKELEKRFNATQPQKDDWCAFWVQYGLKAFDAMIQPHAGAFSFGDQPTAADCYLIPHLTNADRFKVSLENYPTLLKIRANCEKIPAFVKAGPKFQPDTPKDF